MTDTTPSRPTPPQNVMTEVNLLIGDMTTPEDDVSFVPPLRSSVETIKGTINPANPPRWTWANAYARQTQQVTSSDVGSIGYQIDIDSYFSLDDATGPAWTPQPNPDATSSPFELSTGASDAVAYHDFYRLQIAFEDVWAELIDKSIGTTAEVFYAKWDALMNVGSVSDLDNAQVTSQLNSLLGYAASLQSLAIQTVGAAAQTNPAVSPQTYMGVMAGLFAPAIANAKTLQNAPPDGAPSTFGLDLQNFQAELQAAQAGLLALISGPAAATASVTDALAAALQIVTTVKTELSTGAGARIAAYNAIPTEPIGGYEELEHFLNDVRTILSLPQATLPSATGGPDSIDYDNYIDPIALAVQGAFDYLDSFVKTIQHGSGAADVRNALDGSMTSALNRGIDAASALKSNAESPFLRLYGTYVNAIINEMSSALDAYNAVSKHIDDYRDYNAGNVEANTNDLRTHLTNASSNLDSLRSSYQETGSGPSDPSTPSVATDLNFPELEKLFKELSDMLKERYRFDVFAPASINYGLLLNYRQKWQPQSYQVGNLVKTIPLGPGETRKYTSKTVVKKSRNAKELDDSVQTRKEDSSESQRTDAEIFANASQKTDFSANASGNFKIGVYDVHADTHVGGDQSAESKSTKRNQRESVLKAAQEYRDQHHLEVTTEESSESEMTSSAEIRNPNDELTVTYLFYELQRRYLVSELLHQATPVILVANDVPAPHEVDAAWLIRYDWILKRVMLDDSFLPALAYIGSEFAGQESALIILELQAQHQKNVVDQLSRQVQVTNQTVDAATAGVTNAEDWSLNDQRNEEYSKFVKSFFDPLGLSKAGTFDDGNSDRARIDFANEALQRAQVKLNDLNSQMRTELTALQTAVNKFTAAATRHHAMEAQIDRLCLHVKDNIIYYMQAIWSHEPSDQRYFRLYDLDVPVFESDVATVTAQAPAIQPGVPTNANAVIAAANKSHVSVKAPLPKPKLSDDTKKLHQVADIDSLIGFKGNYMIFPLTDFDNYMAWYLIHNYVELDPTAGLVVSDPDTDAGATPEALEAAMQEIFAQDPTSFATYEPQFEEVMLRLLSDQTEQMVIVPSEHLYIEALPGTHPILEDFKLIHRALDVKKVQAEVRHAELENLRLAARLAAGEYGDPDVEKKIVIESTQIPVTVNPGE